MNGVLNITYSKNGFDDSNYRRTEKFLTDCQTTLKPYGIIDNIRYLFDGRMKKAKLVEDMKNHLKRKEIWERFNSIKGKNLEKVASNEE